MRKDQLTVVDLFCGAGGLSLGFQRAGFTVLKSLDSWPTAIAAYRNNLGDHAEVREISNDLSLPQARVYVGGPPCQGFSSAGRRQANDDRNSLVLTFAELIASHQPDAFVFENVEGFLTGEEGRYVFHLLERVIEAGYRVHLLKVNAANFGVPQHRKRVIAIGGLGWNPSVPLPTHAAFGAPGAQLANGALTEQTVTLGQALSVLPKAVPRGLASPDPDHTYTPLGDDDLARAQHLQPGQRMRDLPEHLWHDSYKRRAFRRVMDGTPSERRGGAPSGLRRLNADEPSKAITGGALRDFLHPTEDRTLTLRECATLQTFPLDFQFTGNTAERIQMIGNAVPPQLAFAVASSLRSDLESRASSAGNTQGGALLSFVPTLSEGMSPVLSDVLGRVRSRFMVTRRQKELWA